jgi:acyl carrier protein
LNSQDIEEKILVFIRDELRVEIEDVESDTELVSSGRIDSTDLVRLAAHLERSFDIEIPDEDISADHLDTIAMTARYVLDHAGD